MKREDLLDHILPLQDQWAILQSMVDDLCAEFPADQEWDSNHIDEDYLRGMVVEGAEAVRVLLHLDQQNALDIQNASSALPFHDPELPTPPTSTSPLPSVSSSTSERAVDFFDSDSDEPSEPTDRELFLFNLPVYSLYHWETQELEAVWSSHFDDLVARRAFLALAPGSRNTWAFGPDREICYVQRSPLMEWALYLRTVCFALSHSPLVVPPAPNPHGPGSLQPAFNPPVHV